jgi:hypothetical protein
MVIQLNSVGSQVGAQLSSKAGSVVLSRCVGNKKGHLNFGESMALLCCNGMYHRWYSVETLPLSHVSYSHGDAGTLAKVDCHDHMAASIVHTVSRT